MNIEEKRKRLEEVFELQNIYLDLKQEELLLQKEDIKKLVK